MSALTVPHRSLDTPIIEPANKKGPLKNNGLVGAQKPFNVKDGRNKKIKEAPLVSLECGAENPSISKRRQKPTEALPNEDRSAGVKLFGQRLFSSSEACTSPEIVRLHANIFIYLFNTTFISVD